MKRQLKIISCIIASKLISKQMETALTRKEALGLKTHLTVCKACVFFQKQIISIEKLLSEYSKIIFKIPITPDAELSQDSIKKIKTALKES